jgi:hypothetical protein
MFVDPSDAETEGLGAYVHEKSTRELSEREIPDAHLHRLFDIARSYSHGQPFQRFISLRAEAATSMESHGNYLASAVLGAASAESLLDEVLLMLMWIEGCPLEFVAELFKKKGIVARVKSEYGSRIGGLWSVNAAGPVRDWFESTARLRNRTMHFGYEPTRSEVQQSARAVTGLMQHLRSSVGTKPNIRRYPILAHALLAPDVFATKSKAIHDMTYDVAKAHERWLEFREWRNQIPYDLSGA